MKYHKQGFTLIELLVVIAVIALLSTLAVVALGSARNKVNDSKRLSDMRDVQNGLELYYTNHNAYPMTDGDGVSIGVGTAACLNDEGFASANCANPYLAVLPRDPSSGTYQYRSTDGKSYTIVAVLQSGTDTLRPGTVEVTPSGIKNK